MKPVSPVSITPDRQIVATKARNHETLHGSHFVFSCCRGQRIWLLAVAAMLWSAQAAAHEIGKSQVSVALHDAGFDIDVVVDPDALVSKLEAFGGRPMS